jgi:hypothetical protein
MFKATIEPPSGCRRLSSVYQLKKVPELFRGDSVGIQPTPPPNPQRLDKDVSLRSLISFASLSLSGSLACIHKTLLQPSTMKLFRKRWFSLLVRTGYTSETRSLAPFQCFCGLRFSRNGSCQKSEDRVRALHQRTTVIARRT